MREFLRLCGVREGGIFTRRAASSSGRLRLPHSRNPSFSRILRCRRDDRERDADGSSGVAILLPGNLSMMLLQDALTGAQPEAGERLVFVSSGILGSSILSRSMVPGFTRSQAFGEAGVRDGDDGYGLLAFRGNGQSAAAARMHRMQRVI